MGDILIIPSLLGALSAAVIFFLFRDRQEVAVNKKLNYLLPIYFLVIGSVIFPHLESNIAGALAADSWFEFAVYVVPYVSSLVFGVAAILFIIRKSNGLRTLNLKIGLILFSKTVLLFSLFCFAANYILFSHGTSLHSSGNMADSFGQAFVFGIALAFSPAVLMVSFLFMVYCYVAFMLVAIGVLFAAKGTFFDRKKRLGK